MIETTTVQRVTLKAELGNRIRDVLLEAAGPMRLRDLCRKVNRPAGCDAANKAQYLAQCLDPLLAAGLVLKLDRGVYCAREFRPAKKGGLN